MTFGRSTFIPKHRPSFGRCRGHEFEVLEGVENEPLSSKVIILESDKLNEEELLLSALSSKSPSVFSNPINLILIHKDYPSTKTLDIPLAL